MKLLSSDSIVIGISCVIITTFSGLLYSNFTQKIHVANAKEIGIITYKKRTAQRKYTAQVIWENIQQSSPVYNNDSIRTSNLSEAIIRLKDGTEIELADDSMILLTLSKNSININFEHGTIHAKRVAITGEKIKEIKIISKDATVSIEKSDVKLTKIKDEELNISVSRGTAKIKTEKEEKIIGKDQRVIITKDTKEAKVYKLKLKLVNPPPNEYIITTKKFLSVSFSWDTEGENKTVNFEISKNKNFFNPIVSKNTALNSNITNLPDGRYYWRLSQVSPITKKPDYSETRRLIIIKDSPVQLVQPGNGTIFTFSAKEPIINFSWVKNKIASNYTIEISQDKLFNNISKTFEMQMTDVAVDTLTEGLYYWRVKTKVGFSNISYNGLSPTYSFSINKKMTINPPELISPSHETKTSATMLKDKGIIFSWRKDNQIENYKISIARENNFNDIVFTSTITGNFLEIKKELPPGKYSWRVQGNIENVEKPVFSSTRLFNVLAAENIRQLSPVSGTTINIGEKNKYQPIIFTWSKSNIEGIYQLELSKDKNFIPLSYMKLVNSNSVTLKEVEPGHYFWRVRLIDKNKTEIMVSDSSTVNVEKQVKVAAIAVPEKIPEKAPEKVITSLQIISPVKGSAIYVNNKFLGYDEVIYNTDPGKKQNIKIITKKYHIFTQPVTLEKGEKRKLVAELKKKIIIPTAKLQSSIKFQSTSKPMYHNKTLIIASKNGTIVGLKKDGKKKWRANLNSKSESVPAIYKSTLYTVTVNGYLHAVNLTTGKILWKQKLYGPLLFNSKPIVRGDRIYLATSFGMLYCFSLDGKEIWKKDAGGGVYSSIAYDYGTIYVGTDARRLYAFDANDGDEEWSFRVDSRIISSSPYIHNGTLFIGCYSGSFYAIDIKERELKWVFKARGSVLSNAISFKNTIYFGSVDGFLYALNIKDGSLLWKYNTKYKILSEPVIYKKHIFITSGKVIYAINSETGKLKLKKIFSHHIKTSVTTVGDDIYVGLINGEVVSYRFSF